MSDRRFPIQRRQLSDDPTSIPWADAEIAYEAYSRMYGKQQTLERLAERGGFGWVEYLALNDTAVFMRANPTASGRDRHDVMERALTAQSLMHPTEFEKRQRRG